MNIILQERDYIIFQKITKYRFLLARQVKILCDFVSQRTTNRRLKKLCDVGYLKKVYLLYGYPPIYSVTQKAKRAFNLEYITKSIRIEQLEHEIAVIDTSIYFQHVKNINEQKIQTERQAKHLSGFSKAKHRPDLTFDRVCIEIELNMKRDTLFEKNVKDNFKNFDKQIWVVPSTKKAVLHRLDKLRKRYPNIEVLFLEEVQTYVKKL